jgi:hypothetical protein
MTRQTVAETLIRLEAHERECLVRYEGIQRQLSEGSKKFDRMERMIIAIYPFILTAIAFAKWG